MSNALLILFFPAEVRLYPRPQDDFIYFWHPRTDSVFEQFGELPDTLRPTGKQVLSFVGAHLNANTHVFDWAALKDDLDDYEETNMTFDKFKNFPLAQKFTKVSDLTSKISEFFQDILPVQKSTEELTAIIGGALTGFEEKRAKGFASFAIEKEKPKSADSSAQGSSCSSGGLLKSFLGCHDTPESPTADPVNSSYTYRILFQIKSTRIESDFYSLVSTVKIIADIEKEQDWWKLESTTEKNFGVKITAIELVVTQGFKRTIA